MKKIILLAMATAMIGMACQPSGSAPPDAIQATAVTYEPQAALTPPEVRMPYLAQHIAQPAVTIPTAITPGHAGRQIMHIFTCSGGSCHPHPVTPYDPGLGGSI